MQFLLKFIYLIVRSLPIILRAETLKSLNHDSAIPCSVKYSHMPRLWKSCPKSPQKMPCLLVWLRTCYRIYHITSRIKCLRYPFDISTFACRIPTFVAYDNRYPLLVKLIVQSAEFLLQLVKFLLVLLIRQFLVERHLGKFRDLLERKCILQYRYSMPLIEQRSLYSLIDDIEYLKFCPFSLLCIYHVPRCI